MGRVVIVAYKPKEGKQKELEALMQTHIPRLRLENLVTDREPVIIRSEDGTIVEVFEWASKEAIESAHTNPSVLAMWQEFADVCEFLPVSQVQEASQMFSEFEPLN
jgi:quinol monooxygenase YgiN